MTVLLAIALFGPALLLVEARIAPSATTARRVSSMGALAVGGVWLVLFLVDPDVTLGRFGAGAAPASVGTWLLVAAVTWPTQRWSIALTTMAAGIGVGGLALRAGGGDTSDAAGALAIAAALVVLAARREGDGGMAPAVVAVLGAAALALGVAADGVVLTTIGCAAIAAAGAARPRRAGSVLLPAVLVLGIASGGGDRVAVVLAVAAALAASRPPVALSLWAIATAAAGAQGGAALLGAGAVVLAAAVNPLVAAVALPGAAATAAALADAGGVTKVALGVLATVTVVRVARVEIDARSGTPSAPTVAALVLGAWLLLAPQTWSWVGVAELTDWRTAVLLAVVGAAAGAFAVASFTDLTFSLPALDVGDPVTPAGDGRWARFAAPVALVALAACGAVLVASSVS
jgi:hypothetical protein